jgi:hypothetical protein
LLPLLTGTERAPSGPSRSRSTNTTSTHSVNPAPGPGSRSKTTRSGHPTAGAARAGVPRAGRCAEPPLRHVQLERRDLPEPRQRGRCFEHRVEPRAVILDLDAAQPRRRPRFQVLGEERWPANAIWPPFAGRGSAVQVREHRRGDLDVEGHHLCLRCSGRRVQDTPRGGEPDFLTGDLQHRAVTRHVGADRGCVSYHRSSQSDGSAAFDRSGGPDNGSRLGRPP